MSSLPTLLRRQLEAAVRQARKIAEAGARHALQALAVHEPDPYLHMDEAARTLRRQLQAQAKQLGDGESRLKPGVYEIKHLAEKLAYDQWHRLLFARYLLDNNLLISPEHGVAVSLDDCEELAPSAGCKDAWAVAARFAAKELPEIFRADDPAGAVELAVNDRQPLIALVTGLAVEVFTANDSLGWCYQFWQAEKKAEVNAAGNKIGADELPAVTQLFTEDYMVDFLLDNTLGAWHAGKLLAAKPGLAKTAASEGELREAVALPGCPWAYLRLAQGFVAAGRHGELLARGGRIALGCDAENAGDAVDILRAATLFVGLARDAASDPFSLTAHDALELATIRGAEAINKADIIGSLEPGKQADIVVHSTAGPQFLPRSTDPVLQLIWASDGRSVSEVLIAGRLVVTGGQCRTVELDDLREQARACRDRLLATRV